jgi:hypothetical protein
VRKTERTSEMLHVDSEATPLKTESNRGLEDDAEPCGTAGAVETDRNDALGDLERCVAAEAERDEPAKADPPDTKRPVADCHLAGERRRLEDTRPRPPIRSAAWKRNTRRKYGCLMVGRSRDCATTSLVEFLLAHRGPLEVALAAPLPPVAASEHGGPLQRLLQAVRARTVTALRPCEHVSALTSQPPLHNLCRPTSPENVERRKRPACMSEDEDTCELLLRQAPPLRRRRSCGGG